MVETTVALHSWGHLLARESSPAPDTPRASRFQPSLKHPAVLKFQLDLDTPRISGSQPLTLQDSQFLHLAPNTQILRIQAADITRIPTQR